MPGPGGRDAERWEYVYDGFGRRVRKLHVVNGAAAAYYDFAYDGDQVIAESASTAADPYVPARTFIYGAYIDEPIAMDGADGARYYFVSDATHSIALLLGEAEPGAWAVVERYAYEDFGEPIILGAAGFELTASAFGNPYSFEGRRHDAELGLYYYRNRYYDPVHGRFTARDPLGFWGDPLNMGNPYALSPIVHGWAYFRNCVNVGETHSMWGIPGAGKFRRTNGDSRAGLTVWQCRDPPVRAAAAGPSMIGGTGRREEEVSRS